MKVGAFYPVTLIVDGEEIFLRIKRMNMEEHSEFSLRFAKVGKPTFVRFVSRSSSGPEQDQNDKGEYVISFEQLAENRLAEMSAPRRAEYETAMEADEAEAKKFLAYTLEQFVTVERGLIEELADGTEKSVSAGLDFLRIFGARRDVLQQILEAVRRENELDADQKKALKSPAASAPSSTGRRRARAGRKRGTTAKNAATAGSAGNGGAKATRSTTSGSMETSRSNPAPSSD